MKMRVFRIEARTQLSWSHDCFTFKPYFFCFPNLLWRYALVWLVALEALPFYSISCTNIPQNLQCAAIYLVKDLPVKHGWAPGTAVGAASIGFRSKQKCICLHFGSSNTQRCCGKTPLSCSIFENCPPRSFRGVTTNVIPYLMKSRGIQYYDSKSKTSQILLEQ